MKTVEALMKKHQDTHQAAVEAINGLTPHLSPSDLWQVVELMEKLAVEHLAMPPDDTQPPLY